MKTVTIELAYRIETQEEVQVPDDCNLRDARDYLPAVPEVDPFDEGELVDCYAWRIVDNASGEVWEK